MLTLGEMADLACEKVNKTDDDSLTLCKKFIRRRYKLIYNSYLWKDSLELAEGVVNGSTANSQSNIVIMPRWMERVVAVREGDANTLTVEEQSLFFKKDAGMIGRTGSCAGFHQIKPYWWPEFFEFDYLYFRSLNGADGGREVHIQDPENGSRYSGELISTYEASFDLSVLEGSDLILTKDVTDGPVILWGDPAGTQVSISGEDTSIRYERIRLIDDPGEDVELLVLGKRRAAELVEDFDVPAIQNIEDALIAHAQSDMLERDRQYAKAELKRAEAAMQIRSAIDQERNQSANIVQIVPVSYHTIYNGDDL